MKTRLLKLLLLTLLACGALRPAAHAANWQGGASAQDWGDPINWFPPVVPGAGADAVFSGAITAPDWVLLPTAQSVQSLDFNLPALFQIGTLGGPSAPLTLGYSSSLFYSLNRNGNGDVWINTDVNCGPNLTLDGGPGNGVVRFHGNILGAPSVTVNGGTNSIGAGTAIGGLTLNSILITGGQLNVGNSNTVTVNNAVQITGGTLNVCGVAPSPTFCAPSVTVSGGGMLQGNGTICAGVTVGPAAQIAFLTPGCSAGTLTINGPNGALTLGPGAVLEYQLGTPDIEGNGVNDLVEVTGPVVLNGTLNVTDLGNIAVGSYTLITHTGPLTDNGFALGNMPPGFSYTLAIEPPEPAMPGKVKLNVTPDTTPPTLVSATASCASNKVTLTFSECLDPNTAGEPFNYSINGGVMIQSVIFPGLQTTLLNETFNSGNGGFTVSTPLAYAGQWAYDAGSGSWKELGQNADNAQANTSFLTSPAVTVPGCGPVRLTFAHRHSFEAGNWDGGQVRVSVNNGTFTAVPAAAFSQNGYGGSVAATSSSQLAGQPAFVEESPGHAAGTFITSVASLGSFNPGDTVRVQFMAASDSNTRGAVPNWQIDRAAITFADGKTVLLCPDPLTPLMPGFIYTLGVNGVEDVAGNTINPNPSLKEFSCPPAITMQPQDLTVTVGETATFRVIAIGAGPLSYQWFGFPSTNMKEDETNDTLRINNVQFHDAGAYSVAVSSLTGGSVTSNPALLAVAAAPPCIQSSDPVLLGLVAWWPLDELSGAVNYAELINSTPTPIFTGPLGLGPPLTTGCPQAVAGKVAGASYFPRPTTFGHANNSWWLNFVAGTGNGNGSFSLDCWVMLPGGSVNVPFRTIVDKLHSGATGGYAVGVNNLGQVELRVAAGGPTFTYTSIGAVNFAMWDFIAVVVDRGPALNTVTFHINGVTEPSQNMTGFAGSTLNIVDLLIGGNPGSPPSELSIDELELFNRPLSGTDMAALFAADSAGKCKPPPPCLPVPGNDLCVNAQPLLLNAVLPVCGTTLCATPTPPGDFNPAPPTSPVCGGTLLSNDVWYSVRAACNGMMTVDTCMPCAPNLDIDTVLSAYFLNCNPLTQVSLSACDDDSCGPMFWSSQITFPVTANTTYLIRVADGIQSLGGGFAIRAVQAAPPPTAVCAPDKIVQCGPATMPITQAIFDPPTMPMDNCCGGPAAVMFTGFTPLAGPPCAQITFGSWLITDCNGNSITCVQKVTVIDTTPPTLVCPANFSVNHPAPWVFGTPTATDNCGVPVINLPTTTTNVNAVNCRVTHTRTWQAQDACGLLSLPCSQTVTVNYTAPPPNDLHTAAQTLTVNGASVCGRTLCATPTLAAQFDPNAPTTPLCVPTSLLSRDVWYRVTAACSGPMTVDTCPAPCTVGPNAGLGFDTVLSAYTLVGPLLTQVSPAACNDNTPGCGNGSQSSITFAAVACKTYFFRVAGAALTDAGFFSIRAVQATPPPPPNDQIAGAIPLTVNGGYVCGATACGATPTPANQFNQTPPTWLPCGVSLASPDVWYTVVAACNGQMTVDTCQACPGCPTYDTVLSAYFNNPIPLTQVSPGACNDDACSPSGGFGLQSVITFPVIAGQTYLIRVAGFAGSVGSFAIQAVQSAITPPPNDLCVNATPVNIGSPAACDTTLCGATPSAPGSIPITCGNSLAAPDVWYTFKPACSGQFQIDTCGGCNNTLTKFNTVLDVYADGLGLGCGLLTPVVCNDDALLPVFFKCWVQSRVVFNGFAGVTYYIRVAGNGVAAGDFRLNISLLANTPPPNDLCANPDVVGAGTTRWYNCGANTDGPLGGGCPTVPLHDVWFRYTPASSGVVSLSTCQSGIDTVLSVYSGVHNTPGFTLINCNDNALAGPCQTTPQSYLTFNAVANVPYTIRVGSRFANNTGGGILTILGPNPPATTCPPAVGQLSCRLFQVKGPPNNTPWAWTITAAGCANVSVPFVNGVPAPGNDANTLAQAFVNSINAACAGSGLTAQAFPSANPLWKGLFRICVTCPSFTQLQLAVGPVFSLPQNQCVVPPVGMFTPLPVTGPCSFNPDIISLPSTDQDVDNNGIDDGAQIALGMSADVNGNFIPDETEACLGPGLTLNPEAQVVQLGDNVSLTVAASGTAPFTYQWMRDGTPLSNGGNIAGATSAALSITGVTAADLGAYTVAITNACAGTLTGPADITIVPEAQPVLYNLNLSGGGFSFTFDTKAGFEYRIEYKNDLNDAAWTPLTTVLGTGNPEVIFDPAPHPRMRFYRVRRGDLLACDWSQCSTNSPLAARYDHLAVWTGSEWLIWGGRDGTTVFNDGARYDPVANTWTLMSAAGAPSVRVNSSAVWTGTEMIVWGGSLNTTWLNSGARYNPATDTWAPVTTTGAPVRRRFHSAVMMDSEMIVWGGSYDGGLLNSGGRYNPTSNSWRPMTANSAPIARQYHTAVAADGKMIVWGGLPATGPALGDGGRYDPVTDTWTPVTMTGAPAGREHHTAVTATTTGEMIIWGGTGAIVFNSGGRYNPANDSWTTVTTTGAPGARYVQTAVWTGTEMMVWGGQNITGAPLHTVGLLNTGGCYNPVADTWTALPTTGVPPVRKFHTMVWTGSKAIVWGGFNGGYFNDTWCYRKCP